MKIVQLLPRLNEGGVEVETVELSRELVYSGHESIVISAGGKLSQQIELDGGAHILFDVASKNIFTAPLRIYKLRKLLKELNPDIIHARSRVPAWLSFLANKTLHIPFVTTVHGFNSVNLYSKIMTEGDAVICVSNGVKEYIQKHYNTPSKKITIIHGGIDLDKFNPKNIDLLFVDDFKKQYDLNNKFIISVVGRVTQLKDIETFIKAITKLKRQIPNIKALIVGGVQKDKQSYFQDLKKLVKELELENEVIFTGSQNNIAEIYALSDVVVSSSKKPESFGRSVAEAIAMNTPVVATNHGGVKDIIIDDVNGYFFEVEDSKDLANKIIKAKNLLFDGYNYIQNNFSLEQITKKTLDVYRQVIQKVK
jgi:glycosyltransferase involved in cell wall biosynthesis